MQSKIRIGAFIALSIWSVVSCFIIFSVGAESERRGELVGKYRADSEELERVSNELAGAVGVAQDSGTTASQSEEQAKEIARLAVLAESLKASFKTYRDSAETKIKRLDRKVKALTVIAGILVVCAASGWTAWAVK